MRRLPYPRKSPLTFPIVLLSAIAFLLLVILIAGTVAQAAPAPAGGPRLGGGALPDGTLVGFFTFDTSGQAKWLSELETLETSSVWVFVYNPNTRLDTNQLELTFTWETSSTVTRQVVVDGQVETRTETVWNVTDQRSMFASAPLRGVDYTELEMPKKDGERLTITAGARNSTLEQLTHKTSPVFVKLPRQVVQEAWMTALQILGMGLAAAAAGVVVSRWIYTKAGRHVPTIGGKQWAIGGVLVMIIAHRLWETNREGLVLSGSTPPLILFGLVVAFFTLQIWRDEPDADLFIRIHKNVAASGPEFSSFRRYIPEGEDLHPLSDQPNHVRYVEDTWKAFAFRVAFGARTYLELPENHRWHYNRVKGGFRRLYILEGEKDFEKIQEPHIEFFPPDATWRPTSWIRIHRLGIERVPVSPWAQDKAFVRVLAHLASQQDLAKEHQNLLVRNAELEAALKSGVVTKARKMLDHVLLAFRAVRTGKEFEVTWDEHEDIKDATSVPTAHTETGGEAGAAQPQSQQVPVAAPAPAQPAGGAPP